MNAELLTACDNALAAVLNGVYQGIILTLLVYLVLRLIGPLNAATRYWVWAVTLVLVLGLIPAHYYRNRSAPDSARLTGTPEDVQPALDVPAIPAQLPAASANDPANPEPARFTEILRQALNPISWDITSHAGFPRVGSMLVLLAWLTVTVFKTGLLFGRLYQIRKVKRAALSAGSELTGLFARLKADLAVRRKVDLKLCPVQASPVALGFFHPVILLPEEYASNPVETEHILRHELAHVCRRDDWGNLAQNFIQAGLFFHPAVWWISKRLALEREIACDDYVLQRGAGRRA